MNILESLRGTDRVDLERLAVARGYRAGTTVFCEGDPSDGIVVVVSGRAKVTGAGVDGQDVVLSVVREGEIVGELAGLDHRVRSASLTTLEPARLLFVRGDDFASYLATHPNVTALLLRVVAERLRDADRRVIEFATLDVLSRLCRRLVELVDYWGESCDDGRVEIRLPLTHDELAAWTASSREAITKAFAVLRRRGWVETHRRRVVVINPPALKRQARGL